MPETVIKIEGLKELTRQFKKLGDAAVKDLKKVHLAAAKQVEPTAKREAPRRSGTLAASVRSSGTQKGAKVVAGRASVPYAGPIHFGWRRRNISPQPFLYEAADKRRREVLDTYRDAMGDLIRKYDL